MTVFITLVTSKDLDKPAHVHSLARAFADCTLEICKGLTKN